MTGWRRCGLATLVLAAAVWLSPAPAQAVAPPLAQMNTQPEEEKSEKPAPAFQYVVAILSTFLVLTLICKPSRKG